MNNRKFIKLVKALTSVYLSMNMFVFFQLSTSANYALEAYGFGAGGSEESTSENYDLEAILGELSENTTSATYGVRSGLLFGQEANVPPAPTLTNDTGNRYNRLHITIDNSENTSDTTFAVAISDDNWVTTEWVQDDETVGSTLGLEDFQTYAQWGSGSGTFITGLTPNTTYRVRVKARQGNFTESPLGPEDSAATAEVSISFDIDVSSTDTETAPPYTVDLGVLSTGSVTTASDQIWIDLDTNAEDGGSVYVYGANTGLLSSNVAYTITSTTADLSGANEGYGLQTNSVAQTSGGPLAKVSPYNGASENVGIVDTDVRDIFSSSNDPIVGGRGSIYVKAKVSDTTPAADDYADTLTIIATAGF